MDVTVGLNQETLGALEKLALKLGTTSEYLYQTMVRQVRVEAFQEIGDVVIALLVGIVAGVVLKYSAPKVDWDNVLLYNFLFVGAGVVAVFASVGFVVESVEASRGVMQLLNPEYYATKQVLALLGK